ncbi:TniQ family protein [Ruegeria marisrubri]|nr:TniQ family protein [Ruegeria marisrubri]
MRRARLGLTLPIGRNEPAVAYASRLAALNGCSSLWAFCSLVGLSALKLSRADPEELSRLSDLSGIVVADLARFSIRTNTRATRTLGGQIFPNKDIKIQTQYICPKCVLEASDDREWYHVPPDVFWYLDFVRTCPKHGLLLIPMPEQQVGWFPYDFTARLSQAQIGRETLIGLMTHAPTRVDEFSIASFSGNTDSTWLAGSSAYAVSRASERLGCIIEGFRSARQLSRQELARLADVGFAVLSNGPESLQRVLEKLIEQRGRSSLRKTFGVFFHLMDGKMGDAIPMVRAVLRDVILENFVIHPGDKLLGEVCTTRRFHTLTSASDLTGVHPVKLANVLRSAGLMAEISASDPIMIEAEPAEEMLRKLSSSVLTKDALSFLGLPWRHLMSLQDSGLIAPVNPACRGQYMYCLHELKHLRDAMCKNARVLSEESADLVPVYKAANQSVCSISEVVTLLTSGKLQDVGLVGGEQGFDAIRVDPTEVFEALPAYREVTDAMTREELLKHFGVCAKTLAFLLREGHFDEFRTRCRQSRKVRSYITISSVERFSETYVSLRNLAQEMQISARNLSYLIKGAGLYELPVPEKCRGRFFRREDVLPGNKLMGLDGSNNNTGGSL